MISIVICSISAEKYVAVTEQYRLAMGEHPYEMIRIPDARSMCDGYNRGLDISQGDIVIFSHDDIELWAPDFANRLKNHLRHFDVIGVAGTTRFVHPGWIAAGPPHIFGQVSHAMPGDMASVMYYGTTARIVGGIQAMDGLFLAFRRPVIEKLRWDQLTFTGFHCYDTDCTYRAFRAGFKLGVAIDLPMHHMSIGNFGDQWAEQAIRLVRKHNMNIQQPPNFARISVDYPTRAKAREAMNRLYASLP